MALLDQRKQKDTVSLPILRAVVSAIRGMLARAYRPVCVLAVCEGAII
jgi:hypothetical protein